MEKRKKWVVGSLFDRYPDGDMSPGVGASWRAFRHRRTGGIWYANDGEDFTIVSVESCPSCEGSGVYHSCRACGGLLRSKDGKNGCSCVGGGLSEPCLICDGTGEYYRPSVVRVG